LRKKLVSPKIKSAFWPRNTQRLYIFWTNNLVIIDEKEVDIIHRFQSFYFPQWLLYRWDDLILLKDLQASWCINLEFSAARSPEHCININVHWNLTACNGISFIKHEPQNLITCRGHTMITPWGFAFVPSKMYMGECIINLDFKRFWIHKFNLKKYSRVFNFFIMIFEWSNPYGMMINFYWRSINT